MLHTPLHHSQTSSHTPHSPPFRDLDITPCGSADEGLSGDELSQKEERGTADAPREEEAEAEALRMREGGIFPGEFGRAELPLPTT